MAALLMPVRLAMQRPFFRQLQKHFKVSFAHLLHHIGIVHAPLQKFFKKIPTWYYLGIALNAKTDADLEDITLVKESDVFEREFRVGIGIDTSRKAVEEGLLYSTKMIRMKKEHHPYEKSYGFLIELHIAQENALDEAKDDTQRIYTVLDKEGWATMGGERRAVRFKAYDTGTPYASVSTNGNLLYLATPAVFSNGWKLEPGNSGGGHNKETRRCVPAGSVYFFDEKVEIPRSIGSDNTTQIGYGITRTGVWK